MDSRYFLFPLTVVFPFGVSPKTWCVAVDSFGHFGFNADINSPILMQYINILFK